MEDNAPALSRLQALCWHRLPATEDEARLDCDVAQSITNLFLKRGVRMKGPLLPEQQKSEMRKRVAASTSLGEAIPAVVQFGGSKTAQYCPYPDPDLAEWMAMEQLARICGEVQRLYPPGIRVQLILADEFYAHVFGADETIEPYCGGMEAMLGSIGLDFIRPVRLRDLVQAANPEAVELSYQRNREILERYWRTGDQRAWADLENAGWKGKLPLEQREHYLARAGHVLTKKRFEKARLDVEAESAVLRFLAYALVIAQYDLAGRRNPRMLDLSFVPRSPGEPRDLFKKFYIASCPPGGSGKSAPPWTAQGMLLLPDFQPSLCTAADIEDGRYVPVQELTIEIDGCRLRADLFQKAGESC